MTAVSVTAWDAFDPNHASDQALKLLAVGCYFDGAEVVQAHADECPRCGERLRALSHSDGSDQEAGSAPAAAIKRLVWRAAHPEDDAEER